MMFKCKVCSEKDSRIADLKDQIEMLRKLAAVPTSASDIPYIAREANAILSADVSSPTVERPESRAEKVQREADQILLGSYS